MSNTRYFERTKEQQQPRLTQSRDRDHNEHHERRERRQEPLHNRALSDGLAGLVKQSMAAAGPDQLIPATNTRLPFNPNPNKDGVNFFNFSSSARTELGQLLSFENVLPFQHPMLGFEVPSIQHYWVFLQSGAENYKVFGMNTEQLRTFSRSLGKPVYVRNQYALLAVAYWYKILAYQPIADALASVNGEIDYYLEREGQIKRPMDAPHLVDIMKQLRTTLRRDQEFPDLSRFVDRDITFELRGLTDAARDERIVGLLYDVHETVRRRAEQSRRNKEEYQNRKTGRQNDLVAEEQPVQDPQPVQAEEAAPSQNGAIISSKPFNASEAVQREESNTLAIDVVQADPDEPFNGLNPSDPAAPASPAGAGAPEAPAGASNPAAPAAPTAESDDGNVLVIGTFKQNTAQALAA